MKLKSEQLPLIDSLNGVVQAREDIGLNIPGRGGGKLEFVEIFRVWCSE